MFESLNSLLSGMMQSLATRHWVLISERLISVIGSSCDHPQFFLSNIGAQMQWLCHIVKQSAETVHKSILDHFPLRILALEGSGGILHVQIVLLHFDFVVLITCLVPFLDRCPSSQLSGNRRDF